jgi:hypothetical protein|tara:strand:+ start:3994 stop:4602 length:609 start_codon:yes stop_codon:yes gene_type:complete
MLRKINMDIQAIIDKVLPIFEAHKNEGDIEVEIRLGKHNGSLFDTNVGKDTWKRVLKGLKKYNGWESVKMSTSDVYYSDSNNIRITSDEESGEQTMIQKISVIKEDFKCEPLDVRFCVAREIPTSGEYEMDRKRTKTRHSFVRKNLSIDMTISSGDNADMDSEEEASYQIELEIMKPDAVDDIYKFQNILQKVSDLSKLISA